MLIQDGLVSQEMMVQVQGPGVVCMLSHSYDLRGHLNRTKQKLVMLLGINGEFH